MGRFAISGSDTSVGSSLLVTSANLTSALLAMISSCRQLSRGIALTYFTLESSNHGVV
jgi:hypothetical protein